MAVPNSRLDAARSPSRIRSSGTTSKIMTTSQRRKNSKLLVQIRDNERVNWSGKFRSPIEDRGVYPRPVQERLPIWVGVGGNPGSIERAARMGLPLIIAIIGGAPARFAPLVDYYRECAIAAGRDPSTLRVSINSHLHIAETSRQAADEFFPRIPAAHDPNWVRTGLVANDRSHSGLASPTGALLVGSVDEVIEKILYEYTLFRHDRFVAQVGVGPQPHAEVMHAIELLGTKVAPVVRAEIAKRRGAAA